MDNKKIPQSIIEEAMRKAEAEKIRYHEALAMLLEPKLNLNNNSKKK